MSDVLNGLGSISLLRKDINWRATPKYTFLNSFKVLEYEGTANDFIEVTNRKPQNFNCEILLENKAEEYAFMTFWKARKGGLERFWFPSYPEMLQLKQNALSASTIITCNYTATVFNKERIFIMTNDNDMITAKVESYVSDEDLDTTVLTLSTALGKDIYINDVNSFGMLLLCRFDKNSVEFNYENKDTIVVGISVRELFEYEEV